MLTSRWNLPKLKGNPRYLHRHSQPFVERGQVRNSGGDIVVWRVCLSVSDTGRRTAVNNTLEHFGQGRHDIVDKDKGTGLGLPIVRGLIEAHGGRVGIGKRSWLWHARRSDFPERARVARALEAERETS